MDLTGLRGIGRSTARPPPLGSVSSGCLVTACPDNRQRLSTTISNRIMNTKPTPTRAHQIHSGTLSPPVA